MRTAFNPGSTGGAVRLTPGGDPRHIFSSVAPFFIATTFSVAICSGERFAPLPEIPSNSPILKTRLWKYEVNHHHSIRCEATFTSPTYRRLSFAPYPRYFLKFLIHLTVKSVPMDSQYESVLPSDLRRRISVARGQLENLDEDDDEFSVRKMVLEHGIASLEEQLQSAHHTTGRQQLSEDTKRIDDDVSGTITGAESQRPHSSYTTKPATGFASYAGSTHNAFGGHFASDGVMAGQGRPAATPSWGFSTLEDASTATTPDTPNFPVVNGRSASGSISSPESGLLRPQKRPRDSFGLSSGAHPAKSMRTTPSPAVTGATSPTSLDSFDFGEDPDLARLLGGDPTEDIREMREAQKAHARLLEARKLQERQDEKYARSLAEFEDDLDPFGQSSPARPSIAHRGTSQSILDAHGRYQRSEIPLSSPLNVQGDPFSASSLRVKSENDSHVKGSHIPIKSERSNQKLPTRIPSGDFINLDSDDDDDDDQYESMTALANHPSSDLVEIEPSAFASSGRLAQAQNLYPGTYTSYSDDFGNANASNWGNVASNIGQSLANTATGFYNSAIDLVDQQINGYGTAPMGFGGSSVYGGLSNYVDLDDYDTHPSDFTYDVFDRHGINSHDPANSALVENYRNKIDYITHDPTRTRAEIKSLLENIRPDEDLPPENREGTPEAMRYPLMEHQKLGLAWMKQMEEGSNKGGILADDMGLGKTIQALALIVTRKSTDPLLKTTLIVCPVGLLRQWEREIHKKLKPEHQIKVYILHGDKRDIAWDSLRRFDVVLTTFGTLGTEVKRKEDIARKKRGNPNWRPSGKGDLLPLIGDDCQWFRVIVDEAQCIKNKGTKAALGAFSLQALTRFCMTGSKRLQTFCHLLGMMMDANQTSSSHDEQCKRAVLSHPLSSNQALLRS